MSHKLPWYKKDVNAWRGGTRGLSMELRGFYSECLDAMWDLQSCIPKCPAKLAVMLGTNPRTVRKLMPQLIAAGKIVATKTGYANARMMDDIGLKIEAETAAIEAEIEPKSSSIRPQFGLNSTPIQTEFSSKVPENLLISTREVEVEVEEEKENPLTPKGERVIEVASPGKKSNVTPIANWSTAFLQPDDNGGVEIVDSRIVLLNGTRAYWVGQFGGSAPQLDLALVEITERLNPQSRTAGFKRQIEAKLAAIVRGKLERAENHAKVVRSAAKSKAEPAAFKVSADTVRHARPAPEAV